MKTHKICKLMLMIFDLWPYIFSPIRSNITFICKIIKPPNRKFFIWRARICSLITSILDSTLKEFLNVPDSCAEPTTFCKASLKLQTKTHALSVHVQTVQQQLQDQSTFFVACLPPYGIKMNIKRHIQIVTSYLNYVKCFYIMFLYFN